MAATTAATERANLSLIDNRVPTVARLFSDRVAATPHLEAFRFPAAAGWNSVTWADVASRVNALAAGLVALGVEPEDRVAVASGTRYEWILADLAVMCAGAATTTVYATTSAPDVAYIVADSGSRVVFAEDDGQIAKLRANRSELPDVVKVVAIDGTADGEWIISLGDLEKLGAKLLLDQPSLLEDRANAIGPDSLATLIYTSGTSGTPKGVRL